MQSVAMAVGDVEPHKATHLKQDMLQDIYLSRHVQQALHMRPSDRAMLLPG